MKPYYEERAKYSRIGLIITEHSYVRIQGKASHAGSAALSKITGQPPAGPSAVCHLGQEEELPMEMTAQQIHEVTVWFAQAALRAKQAGVDGVEIHSAHGYLLNRFFSPLANHRTDEYGAQSVENRTRFHREVIQAVRQVVGNVFPIAMRLGCICPS